MSPILACMGRVRVGMHVRGSDKARLGKVVRVDGDGFVVDQGRYFTHEYRVRTGEVIRVDGDTVIVSQHRPEVAEAAGVVHRRRRARAG
jgi:uncharacterized protein (AIM24 family)